MINTAHTTSAEKILAFEPFREKLSKRLYDKERVKQIVDAYQELYYSSPALQKTTTLVEKWLTKNSYFIGCPYYNHNLLYKDFPNLLNDVEFQNAYSLFIDKITPNYLNNNKDLKISSEKKIAILFNGGAGGGHYTCSLAIKTHFENQGTQVQFLDVDQIENCYCPKIAGYKKTEIYQEIYQKENNVQKARELRKKIKSEYTQEKRDYIGDVRRKLLDFQPNHIFSVAHHQPIFSYLSYSLCIPMTFVHTDHIFHKRLLPIIREQQHLMHPLINFTTLSKNPNQVKLLHKNFGKILPSKIKNQLFPLDIPVRTSFQPVSRNEKGEIRTHLGIDPKATTVKIAMGQNGIATEIKNLINSLFEEEKTSNNWHEDLKLCVIVICGKNKSLKNELDKSVQNTNHIFIKIFGFLEEEEMALIDKACDIWITKPGGATCAELVAMQKQMLYVLNKHHPWEKANAAYVEKLKLGEQLSLNRPLIKQIQKRLSIHDMLDLTTLPKTSWKKQINNTPLI